MIKYLKPVDPEVSGKTLRSILLGPSKDGIYRCSTKSRNDIIVFNTVHQGVKAMFVDADGRGFGDVMSRGCGDPFIKEEVEELYNYIGSAQITVIRE